MFRVGVSLTNVKFVKLIGGRTEAMLLVSVASGLQLA